MHEAPTQQTHAAAAAAAAASERASKLWRRGWEINLLEMKFSLSLPPLSISLLSGRLEQMPLAGNGGGDRDGATMESQYSLISTD